MASRPYAKIPAIPTPAAFREQLASLNLDLPCDDLILTNADSPMSQPLRCGPISAGNRWCIQPMEGWDGTSDGHPSDLTRRRWQRFGRSGAKLIWGGEAVAVVPEGRANPNQLILNKGTAADIADLRQILVRSHQEQCGRTDDLVIGLQLTYSGRFCRPERQMEPRILFRHPVLDRRLGLSGQYPLLADSEIRDIIQAYARAAELARNSGFHFVDLKHCHGYLGHEFLGSHTRQGPFGGSFENRTRFLREVVEAIRNRVPDLLLAVRLSAFDLIPYCPDPDDLEGLRLGRGVPETAEIPDRFAFGVDPSNPTEPDLTETYHFLELLLSLGITLVNATAGSPYYNPHIQRPAILPPSDGYQPPEDPLVGCVRQIQVVRLLKARYPALTFVGSAYSYLQEYLPHVAQAVVRQGWVDSVGLGRMVLAYPELPFDTLTHGTLRTKMLCRTFSDCTTAPRNGLVSGCYPLDPEYKNSPQRQQLLEIKKKV